MAQIRAEIVPPNGGVAVLSRLENLHRALADLPAPCRTVVLLHHREGLSFDQVAQRMNCSPETARRLWLCAVRLLGERLEDSDVGS